VFRVIGQPNLNVIVDRQRAARYQINVADVQDAIQTAVGGNAVSQVLQGEQRFDLVLRYRRRIAIRKRPSPTFACWRPPASACRWGSFAASRPRRRLGDLSRSQPALRCGQIQRARARPRKHRRRSDGQGEPAGQAASGLQVRLAGEYESQKRSQARLAVIVPITIFLIFMILYSAFGSAKWACLNLMNLFIAPIGGLFALLFTGTHFSVSSASVSWPCSALRCKSA